jgi:hypothetical protein
MSKEKLNLDDICKIYIQEPERAVDIVKGRYLCSREKAVQILNRKCKNFLSEDEFEEFFNLTKSKKESYATRYKNEIRTKYPISTGMTCDAIQTNLDKLYVKLDEKTLQKTTAKKKNDVERATIYVDALNDQISLAQNALIDNRCDEIASEKRSAEERMLVGQLTQSNKQLQTQGGTSTMTKVILGVGAVLLMGGIFYAIKKSKN